jgi:hypothetical protein
MSLNIEFTSTIPPTSVAAAPVAVPSLGPESEAEISLGHLIIPVSNGLPATLYQQWHICAHKYSMELREVLEDALKAYFKAKLKCTDKLPLRKQAKVDKKIHIEREKLQAKWS